MSILSSLWKPIQSIAKPFIAQIPVVGGFAASRIDMSPTPAQAQATASLGPTANDVAKQIQDALAAQRASEATAAAAAQAARDELAAADAARRAALTAPGAPITGSTAPGMPKDQMILYGGIAAAILLVVLLGNRR